MYHESDFTEYSESENFINPAEGSSGKFNDVVVRLHHVEVSQLSSWHLNYFFPLRSFSLGDITSETTPPADQSWVWS